MIIIIINLIFSIRVLVSVSLFSLMIMIFMNINILILISVAGLKKISSQCLAAHRTENLRFHRKAPTRGIFIRLGIRIPPVGALL